MAVISERPAASEESRRLATVVGVVLIPAYLLALTWSMQRRSYETWGALLLAPVLILLPAALFMRLARRDPDPRIARLVRNAILVKLVGVVVRYVVAYGVYGRSDATAYHRVGGRIADSFRQGDFDVIRGIGSRGTWFIGQVVGWLYTVTGPSRIIGFIGFSWLSFAGMYLFYKAFRVAFPEGDHYRYALLIFFLPSLVYWPSSMGKDAWMVFGLGVTAYGIAAMLTFHRWGILVTALGFWATAAVRSHITLIAAISLVVGYVLRRSRSSNKVAAKVVGIGLMVVVATVALGRSGNFFGLDQINSESAESVLDEAERRTSQGGSSFSGQRVRTPADLPVATITVLFRPLPIEVRNAQAAISSLEGLILLGICLKSWRQLRSLPRRVLASPYVAVAATFTLFFIVAFSVINNFGILARQRVQAYPFFLVLLCVPPRPKPERPGASQALTLLLGPPAPATDASGAVSSVVVDRSSGS